MKKFGEALENKDFEGKGDSDIFKELTQNDGSDIISDYLESVTDDNGTPLLYLGASL